jgi:2-C-methyl-D-erythritol 4-phosphate cytidylyltransferase
MRVGAVIPTAGQGTRMGADRNKLFLEINGISVLERTLAVFLNHPDITHLCLVTAADEQEAVALAVRQAAGRGRRPQQPHICYAPGGATRRESVHNGLLKLAEGGFAEHDIVMVHDGARCFIQPDLISACLTATLADGSAVAAVPVKDTIKEVDGDGVITATPERSRLWQVQTPQCFRFGRLASAYRNGPAEATDDASLVEACGQRVKIIRGSELNIKITTPEDLLFGECIATRLDAAVKPTP